MAIRFPALPPALAALLWLSACTTPRLPPVTEHPEPVGTASFAREMRQVARAPWVQGNDVKALVNGGEFFPAMLGAIRSAKEAVMFETYVCVDSPQVEAFANAFRERARAGVQVRVLLDAFGCNSFGKRHLAAMKRDGVDVRLYHRFNPLRPLEYNNRTHRRILVVDGKVAFVGGAGVAYAWDGNAEDRLRWRDTQFVIRGPVVRELMALFNDNWSEVTGAAADIPEMSAISPPAGTMAVEAVAGAPGRAVIGPSNLLALRAARRKILISHSYFLPPREVSDALVEAARRGVAIEMIIPGKHSDMPICLPTAAPALRRLLEAGAKIYTYEPCMMHTKLVVIDDELTVAGSGNIDGRSFFINDENNIHVLSRAFAAEQESIFEADKARSRPLTRENLRLTPVQRFHGFIGRLVERQL